MNPNNPPTRRGDNSSARVVAIIATFCLLAMLIFIIVQPRTHQSAAPANVADSGYTPTPMTVTHSGRGLDVSQPSNDLPPPARPAAEIVAEKVSQFARSRQDIVAAMAKHSDVAVPDEVNRYFAAVQAGRWEETTNLFASLQKLRNTENWPPGLEKLMPAIVETYGIAEATHKWPAQKLLDYGNAVLESLRPGMVYVGGNDAGRFIPTLLTDTGEGEPQIVLTQNGLADGTYLEYVRFRYGDRLNALTAEDSQNGFQTYMADARKRVQHDQDFPDEPKQVRPGEDIQVNDGRVQVSGQVAVMAINEQLLKTLLTKNPDLSFALTESFPLQSLYSEATTLGPITELRATDSTSALTPERAAQSLDYWRSTTQTLLADPEAAASSTARDAYAKLILGQAGLFVDRKLSAEAEQAFQLATSLSPANAEGVFRYVALLTDQKRYTEAQQIVQTAANAAPDNQQFRDVMTVLSRMK